METYSKQTTLLSNWLEKRNLLNLARNLTFWENHQNSGACEVPETDTNRITQKRQTPKPNKLICIVLFLE